MYRFRALGTAVILALACGLPTRVTGQTAPQAPTLSGSAQEHLEKQNVDLQNKVDAMQQQMDSLKQQVAETRVPLTQPVASGNLFQSVFLDNKPIEFPGDVKAGWDQGFYVQQGDEFKIQFDGLMDFRYNFVQATNKTPLTTTPLGKVHTGDFSGFNLYNGQVSLQGYLFKNFSFKVMGNFGTRTGSVPPQEGSFQLNELWACYEFAPGLKLRAGSIGIPFLPLRAIIDYGGLTFPDVSDAVGPSLPGYGLGADVYGTFAQNTISYDLMVTNGANSQGLTDSTLSADGRDNRLGIYTRECYVGSGVLSDFFEESDLQNHEKFVWMLGGGLAYESQNPSASAFPGPETSLTAGGLSAAQGQGFVKYIVNGNVYRYTADVRAKYRGFSFFGEAVYSQIVAASGTPIPHYTQHSVGQIGYFVQAGYFLVPRKLEVAGRFGELLTNGLSHQMDEYEVGLNYYPFGQNLKVQLAETYIPHQAAVTSNNGAQLNTQDYITQVQVQLKF